MDWWVDRLRPFTDYCVGSIVPGGYELVGRLFHPVEVGETETESWAELAERNSRIAHPDMQLHAIATPVGQTVREPLRNGPYCETGDLPERETYLLRDVATRYTNTPDTCWFGVWDGYGDITSAATAVAAGTNHRKYFLLGGSLSDMASARDLLGHQTPNLWWPHDRSWFIATEIDFCWTLIGGPATMIAELQANPALEVMATTYDADHTVHGDTVNR